MKFNSLSLRALLIASTAILAPAFAVAQTETEAETETESEAAPAPVETTPEVAEDDYRLNEVVVLGRYIPEVLRSTSEVAAYLAPELRAPGAGVQRGHAQAGQEGAGVFGR